MGFRSALAFQHKFLLKIDSRNCGLINAARGSISLEWRETPKPGFANAC